MEERKNLIRSRTTECVALAMVGDGVLALAQPRRHVLLWLNGPEPWRKAMKPFAERPGMTRCFGVLEMGVGLWLASRQQPSHWK